MKSILISIRPEWVAKILNGEKKIEIRRSKPKRELPIDVYIYCTKSKYSELRKSVLDGWYINSPLDHPFNGKVVGKFTLRKVEELDVGNPYGEPTKHLLNEACVTLGEARTYAGGTHPRYKTLFAWHISDLEIFDEPKPLADFKGGKIFGDKPPQSWKYIEVEK